MKHKRALKLCIIVGLCFGSVAGLFSQQKRITVEEWEKRLNKLQPPKEIMDAIGIKPGMIIGEIGAGTGRVTVWLADRVGDEGKIYANDIDRQALDHLERRCEKDNLLNVVTILGEVEDPLLPQNTLDLAFMINVYHHLDMPVALARNIIPSLKSTGILAIVDADPDKSNFGPGHSTPMEEMLAQLDEAGYKLIRVETFLPDDNIYICRPKQQKQSFLDCQ
jgi:ubiquinone/menaquinone biosynthesis C-methylase UbiE